MRLAATFVVAGLLAAQDTSWTRGRLGAPAPRPGKVTMLEGLLVDASCPDRSASNLRQPPELPPPAALPNDPAAHQADRSCAITRATRGFALLTKDGRLLNLNEGGNTLAMQALHAIPDGRAMLNGTGGGIKPKVTLRGRVHGDRVIVEKIVKL
jgi:hypothetical protein